MLLEFTPPPAPPPAPPELEVPLSCAGEITDPSLTTVDQPGFEMGQEAARLLIRQIELKDKDQDDPVPETKVLKTKLIIRNSSLRKSKKQ